MSYGESEYVRARRERDLKQYADAEALKSFRKTYKHQIENGLTLGQFKSTHQTTQEDERLFRQITEEVDLEKKLGAAFLEGFTNPDFMASRRG